MEGHPRPPAGGPPQAQPQPPHDPPSPSQYTTFPEVANSHYSAPEVVYYSAPEPVPPRYYSPYEQHAMSDESPTVIGEASDDKHLAFPEDQSTARSPLGHELSSEKAEKPAAMRRRTIWILVAVAILVVIGAAVGGGAGGAAAARSKAAGEASQLSSSSTSQPSLSPTPQPSSTSPPPTAPSPLPTGSSSSIAGNVCIAGTGEGNFLGLCSFACHYAYVPAPCTCTAWGPAVPRPTSTGQKGYPRVDVPDRCSYLGLCSFAWDRGYTDNLAACSPDPAGAVGCS